ncbi:MAG: 50S ribosomal protein L23 [Candidatus Hermodarchaeota archaeon]
MRPHEVISYPLGTEAAFNLIESENKLVFIVNRKANKHQIKEAVEFLFNVKVVKVNTLIAPNGKKKAFVKLGPEHLAMDVATQLGIF